MPISKLSLKRCVVVDCGYAYNLVCCYDDKYTKPTQVFRGENAVHGENVIPSKLLQKYHEEKIQQTIEND